MKKTLFSFVLFFLVFSENTFAVNEQSTKEPLAVVRWLSWDTGASICSDPIPISKAVEIFQYYRDNPSAQRNTRQTVPLVFKEGTKEFSEACKK